MKTKPKLELKKWIVPCSWVMAADLEIEAGTLDDAIEIASESAQPLPDGTYLQGSFEIDGCAAELMNEKEAR